MIFGRVWSLNKLRK